MPETPAIVEHLLKILTEQYFPYVKRAILWLEVTSGEKSKRAIYELKDALDHIALALHADTDEKQAEKHLNAVEEHFRRAAVEPAEWIALEELRKLLKMRDRGFWWWRLFLLKSPDSKEFDKKILEGQELVTKGREFKAVSLKESYNHLKEAYLVFHELGVELQPAELRSRIFAVLLCLLGLILGLVLSRLVC